MSSGTRRLQRIGHVGLLAGPEVEDLPLAVLVIASAAVQVDHEARLDERAMLLQKKGRTIRITARFLIRGESGDDIALGLEPLAFQTDERLEQSCVTVFHIDCATPIEPTVLLRQLEWIDGPVFGPGFHHIEMSQKQNSAATAPAPISDDDIALVRVG